MRRKQQESRATKRTPEYASEHVDVILEASDSTSAHKRRRLSKISEKKYACPEEECGKAYSRAEHLYRHQLNHQPKQIYHCSFDGCERFFVRQDLCVRHRERHTNVNSHLSRKAASDPAKALAASPQSSSRAEGTQSIPSRKDDQHISYSSRQPSTSDGSDTYVSTSTADLSRDNASVKHPSSALDSQINTHQSTSRLSSIVDDTQPPLSSSGESSVTASSNAPTQPAIFGYDSVQNHLFMGSDSTMRPPTHIHALATTTLDRPHGYGVSLATTNHQSSVADPYVVQNLDPSFPIPRSHQSGQLLPMYANSGPSTLFSTSNVGSMPTLPPLGFPFMPSQHMDGRSDSVTSYASECASTNAQHRVSLHSHTFEDASLLVPAAMTMPVFSHETLNHMQIGLGDDFMGWLFGDEQQNVSHSPTSHVPNHTLDHDFNSMQRDSRGSTIRLPSEPHPDLSLLPNVLESGQPESDLSVNTLLPYCERGLTSSKESRRQRLLDMIKADFRDERHAHVTQHRQRVLIGDHDKDSHVLSLRMLQIYITSFWKNIHCQMPIMHRPTFSAETCPDLLLVAIVALGASCLEKGHGYEATHAGAELSFFLAWHARHLIYEDPDFSSPAKLWVFQALLILEIFEKMYSTRSLHERAHVHHATTLTLMRRGSSLIGRSAADYPTHAEDPTRTPPGPNGSINTSGRNTADAWWNLWISNEATRRTAYAAFIIDTTHATMFGHSAVMVAHEMRIPLPCDERLWSATSGQEVHRMEQEQLVRGLSPLYFLDGLKKTLNGQSVRTNTFGRVVMMSGLLSISWNQKMQDVRVTSTGVGKPSPWGSQLRNAFDFWKEDFDAGLSLGAPRNAYMGHWQFPYGHDAENVFESRTVLHCLAHMAMHVDIIDCQIFAGAKRLLGRVITPQEHAAAAKRMRETWAPSARARDATFYALRFLSEVLLPEGYAPGSTPHTANLDFIYSARDDNLLNRPWVLYFASLVVWSYGYALDGPMAPPTYTLSARENKIKDMQGFLRRVGSVKAPDDLQNVQQRNSCLGLLMLLKELFRTARWELLHESAALLHNCIDILMPSIAQ